MVGLAPNCLDAILAKLLLASLRAAVSIRASISFNVVFLFFRNVQPFRAPLLDDLFFYGRFEEHIVNSHFHDLKSA